MLFFTTTGKNNILFTQLDELHGMTNTVGTGGARGCY